MKRFAALTGFLCLIGLAFTVRATDPAWWTNSATQVIDPNSDHSTAANYAPANLGQLKNVARQAKLHLDTYLPGGAGTQIGDMVTAFSTDPAVNYAPINLGQLKAVARPFYDRLGSAGYDTKANLVAHGYPATWSFSYPWDPSTPISANYAPANLGQVKMAFSFDLAGKTASLDGDGDGLPDAWEIANFGSLDPRPAQDDDHDGQTNAQEWAAGTDPNSPQGAEVPGLWMYEYYSNITGVTIADLRNAPIYPGQPTGRTYVGTPDAPHDWADNYGSRLTGYIVVPTTGSYQFVVAGDNEAELWLSTTGKPAGLQKVASVPNGNWTNYREWTKYPQQTSASMQLTAGQELFVQVLQKEGTGGDNASVGWIAPGTTTAVPIPSTAMRGVGSLAIDSDSDGLPDFWEIANFGNLDHKPNQDDDHDGKTNAQEFAAGTDPNEPLGAKVAGVWLYETYDNISGATLASLRSAAIYPGQPTGRTYVATADAPQNRADNFGSRMSGYIVIPDTGYYQFAVAGDDETELWLSTSGKPGGLQKMAYVPSGRFTGYQEWTKYSQQKSTSMFLTAGQELYVEVLEKEGTGGDNASVGWIVPGDTTVQPLPQEVLEAAGDVSIDADHDGLPDFWEIAYFGNITPSPTDDPDGDGRSNLQEYQQGSDPNDFYNGVPPSIEVTSGNWQTGKPNAFLPQPLRIRLIDNNGAPYTNSPVTFTISDGDGQLAPTVTGSPTLSQAVTLRTDANGYAQVYLYQGVSDSSGVEVDAGDQTAAFSESVDTLGVGLLGEWDFEELSGSSTADISGNNQTGTLSGGAAFGINRAEGNRSMTFNGTTASVKVADSSALNLSGTTMSLALWVKPDGTGTRQTLLAKSGSQAYRLFLNSDETIGLSLALPDGTLAQATSPFAVPDGAWTHVAVTLSISSTQATISFYLNGVSNGSQTLSSISQIRAAAGALTFGVLDATSNAEAFSGSLDDIRIYNRALEASEVNSIFKIGTPSSPVHGLVGAYYVGKEFEILGTRRIDPWVNFDWGLNAPNSYVPADGFSVRWTGSIKPRYSETYTFKTVSDDGIRLWVNGQKVIDNWTEHSRTTNTSQTIALQGGQLYDIKIEYFDTVKSPGYAVAQLSWSSPSQALEIVPSSRLYPWNAPDAWKQRIVDADPNDNITSIDQVLPGDDFDHDGLPNFMEYQLGTDPTDPDTDHDGLTDGEEAGADWPFATGTSPTNRYSNGDGRQDYADYVHVTVGLLQNVWRDANWLYNPNFYSPDNHSLSLHMQDPEHPDQYVFTNLIDSTNYHGYGPDHGVGTIRSFFIKRGVFALLALKSANPYYDPSLLPIVPRSSINILRAVRKRKHHLIQIWSSIDWRGHTDTYNLSMWKYGTQSRPGIGVPGMQMTSFPHPNPPLGPEWGNNSGRFVYYGDLGNVFEALFNKTGIAWIPGAAPVGSGAYDTGTSDFPGTSTWTDSSYTAASSGLGSLAPGGNYPPQWSPYGGLYVADLRPYSWIFDVSVDPDSDHDGLSDAQEIEIFHTNPNSNDSDNDGLPDAWEVANKLNPNSSDAYDDADCDGWPNIFEYYHGTKATVFGQAADPTHVVTNPPPVFTVDAVHGADSSTDTIFSTIQEAIDAAEKNTGTESNPVFPNRFAVIKVKPGTYNENLTTGPAEVMLMRDDTSSSTDPVTIQAGSGDAIQINGPSVWNGFVVTHADNASGRGVSITRIGDKAAVRFENCMICNNKLDVANGVGAAIYNGSSSGIVDLLQCTLAYNSAAADGDGIFSYSPINITNSILWDAGSAAHEIAADQGYTPPVSVVASIIRGGQYGGLDVDPLLAAGGWLTAQSPAIDRPGVLTVINRDINGEPRPTGIGSDLGADEWKNSTPQANSLPDWWKAKYFGTRSVSDQGDDDLPQPDRVSNLQEYQDGTDPTDASSVLPHAPSPSVGTDTDGDGMPDAYETANGLDPNVNDAYADKDGDGWPNIFEYRHGTRATLAGQSADPSNFIANPPPVFTVDVAHGADSSTDDVFSTIQEALDRARAVDYAVVVVKSGTYTENLYTGNSHVLIIGEAGLNPPVISGDAGTTVTIDGPSIFDGFVITHAPNAQGAGIEVDTNEHVRLVNCVIRDNSLKSTYENGAGVFQNSAIGQLDLVHCTLTRNSAAAHGNGIYTFGHLALINSILWDAGAAADEVGTPDTNQSQVNVTASIVKGGTFGGIDQDPLLTHEGWLTASSPAIDRSGVTTVISQDIHNQPRPNGSAPDLGADEWTNSDGSADDSLPDWWERKYFGNPSATTANSGNSDTVGSDNLTNLDEYLQGTNPTLGDTDADGLSDSDEIAAGTDPNLADTDGDGINDKVELADKTDPRNPDNFSNRRIACFSFDLPNLIGNEGQLPRTSTGVVQVSGVSGNAVRLDAADQNLQYDWLRSDGSANFTPRQGTIRLWFKLDWTPGENSMSGYWSRLFELGAPGAAQSAVYFDKTDQVLHFFQADGRGHTSDLPASFANHPIIPGQWTQLVVTYSPTSQKVYLDGELIGQGAQAWGFTPKSQDLIANGLKFGTDGSQPLRGAIDEVEIFNYELGSDQIATDFQSPIVNSDLVAPAVIGEPFTYQITATNSPTSFSLGSIVGPNPNWLSLDPNTGILQGSPGPGDAGDYTITVRATNDAGDSNSATIHITVSTTEAIGSQPVISISGSPSFVKGTSATFQPTFLNSPTLFNAINLPPGLVIDTHTGVISGTPTQAGSSIVTYSATNAYGTTTNDLTFQVNEPNAALTSSLALTEIVDSSFTYSITANHDPDVFSASSLPSWASFDASTGTITGKNAVQGTYTIPISATNSTAGTTASGTLQITVTAAPVIQSPLTVSCPLGEQFFYAIVAGNNPTSFDAENLPQGLYINPLTGTISGTPVIPGTYTIPISATNAFGTAAATLALTVGDINSSAPVITSPLIVYTTAGQPFSYTFSATGDSTSYTVSHLPAGFIYNSNTHQISGTPTSPPVIQIVLTAANSAGESQKTLSIAVESNTSTAVLTTDFQGGVTPTLDYPTISATIEHNPMATSFDSIFLRGIHCGYVEPQFYAVERGLIGFDISYLPPDSTISSAAMTLTSYEMYLPFSAELHAATRSFSPGATSWTTNNSYISTVLASSNVTTGDAEQPVVWQFDAQNSNAAFKAYVQNSLNSSRRLDLMLVDPNAEAAAASDANGGSSSGGTYYSYAQFYAEDAPAQNKRPKLTISYTSAAPAIILPGQEFFVQSGTAVTIKPGILNAPTGGAGNYSAPLLPSGLSMGSATGEISGTPSVLGDFTVPINVNNGNGVATGTITIHLGNQPFLSPTISLTSNVGATINYTIPASGGVTRYSLQNGDSLPPGLSLDPINGTITGSYTGSSGTKTVGIVATNAYGSSPSSLTFTFNPTIQPEISDSDLQFTGVAKEEMRFSIPATGYPTFSVSGLPSWLGASQNGSHEDFGGVPPAVGTYQFNIVATNSLGSSGTKTVTLTIQEPLAPIIPDQVLVGSTTATSFKGQVQGTYPYLDPPYSDYLAFTAPALLSSTGLTIDPSSGVISGSTPAAGTYPVTVTATSVNTGKSGTGQVTLKIFGPGPEFMGPFSDTLVLGTNYSRQIDFGGSEVPSMVSATNLPAGLGITHDDSGYWYISGTPLASGTFTAHITATNSGGINTADFIFTVQSPAVTSALSVTGQVGVPFSYQITAPNTPTGFKAEGLPAWLSMDASGLISGTPVAADLLKIPITVSNANGTSKATLVVTIEPSQADSTIAFQSKVSPSASYEVANANVIRDTTDSTQADTAHGAAAQFVIGNPTASQTERGLISFDISSIPSNATITGAELVMNAVAGHSLGSPMRVEVHQTEGFDPQSATWSNDGNYEGDVLSFLDLNPLGLQGSQTFHGTAAFTQSLQLVKSGSGMISLAIAAPASEGQGAGYATFTADDSNASLNPQLVISYKEAPPTSVPTITSATSATGTIGASLLYRITATGAPTSFAASDLPPGLTCNSVTGAITGTLSAVGSFHATVTATNSVGTSAPQEVVFNVDSVEQSTALQIISGNNQIQLPGIFVAQPLQVQARTDSGPLVDTLVTYTVPAGDGMLAITDQGTPKLYQTLSVNTDASGNAAVYFYTSEALKVSHIQVTSGTAPATEFVETSVPTLSGPGGKALVLSLVSGGGQGGPSGSYLAAPFVIQASNEVGQPISGLSVTFNAVSGGASVSGNKSGSSSVYTAITDAYGRASVYIAPGGAVGTSTIVTASASLNGIQASQTITLITNPIYISSDNDQNSGETPNPGGGNGGAHFAPFPVNIQVHDVQAKAGSQDDPQNITVSWVEDNPGAVNGYLVERKDSLNGWTVVATTGSTSCPDSGLSADERYQYRVYAYRNDNGMQYAPVSNVASYYIPLVKSLSLQQKVYEVNDSDSDHMDGHDGDDFQGQGDDLDPTWEQVAVAGGTSGGAAYEDHMTLGQYKFKLNSSKGKGFEWYYIFENKYVDEDGEIKGDPNAQPRIINTYQWSGGGTETSLYNAFPDQDGTYFVSLGPTFNIYENGGKGQLDSTEKSQTGAMVQSGTSGAGAFSVSIPDEFNASGFSINYDAASFEVFDKNKQLVSSGTFIKDNTGDFTVVAKKGAHNNDSTTITVSYYDKDGKQFGSESNKFTYTEDRDYSISLDEASGPRYRKIALNGLPMPDEKPQHAPETDQQREETYVDALTLGLRHSTTDVYIPIPGSDFAISARRDFRSEVWNMRSGVRPDEDPARPFGICWSSNLAANIHFVKAVKAGRQTPPTEPDKAYVTDESGGLHTFYLWYDADGNAKYFPMPSAQNEEAPNLESLTADTSASPAKYTFRRKYGTTIVFEEADDKIVLPDDRLVGSTTYQVHYYARMTKATDRYGNVMRYQFEGGSNLVPKTITMDNRPDVKLYIQQDGNEHITAIWDARGYKTTFDYKSENYGDAPNQGSVEELTAVHSPNGGTTSYTYDIAKEDDAKPHRLVEPVTPCWHADLTSIEDPLHHQYKFDYQFDTSKLTFMARPGVWVGYYVQNGFPRNLTTITLPSGDITKFDNHSKIWISFDSNGNGVPEGTRENSVTDASGFKRTYRFGNPQVISLPEFKTKYLAEYQSHTFTDPKLICYPKMTVQYGNLGSETFNFDIGAAMALSSVKDFSGNTTQFVHADPWTADADYRAIMTNVDVNGYYGDPTQQINALGKSKSFTYTPGSRLMATSTDEEGRKTVDQFDGKERRISESIYPDGGSVPAKVTTWDYSDPRFPGFVTKTTIHRGASDPAWATDSVTQFVPDSDGRIGQEIVDPNGLHLVTKYKYDNDGNKVSETDPRGNTTWFSYDGENHLITVTYADGSQKQMVYDLRGNKTKEYDENGYADLYAYDNMNRLSDRARDMNGNGIIDPNADYVTHYDYNKVDSKVQETDPRHHPTKYGYDVIQRLHTLTDARNYTTTYDYGANSGAGAFDSSGFKPTKITDPRGYVTQITYDSLYRTTAKYVQYSFSQPAAATRTGYDNVGNPTSVTDPLSHATRTTYDALNRPTTITYADNTTSQTDYTATGYKWRVTDENGHKTETQFDAAGRATTILQEAVDDGTGVVRQPITTTHYDAAGNLVEKIDPRGNTWTYIYDARNRKRVEIQPQVHDAVSNTNSYPALRWDYDAGGRLVTTTDARGGVTTNAYDSANRIKDTYAPTVPVFGGGTVSPHTHTEYDENGNALTVEDPDSHTTTNTYDELNHLKTTTDAKGILVTYEYDEAGNRSAVIDGKSQRTDFKYDGLNRNTQVTDNLTHATGFTYDGVNKTSRTDALGQTTSYGYDARNRLQTVSYLSRSQDNRVYSYDNAGNLLGVTEAGLGSTSGAAWKSGLADVAYTYDALNRQSTETSGGFTHTYKYDLNGNRVYCLYGGTTNAITSAYDALNRLKTLTEGGRTTTYDYDLSGNTCSRSMANGDVVSSTYDALNRTAETSAVHGSGFLYDFVYKYDAVGNLKQVAENYGGSSTLNRTVTTDYDEIYRLVTETITGSGAGVTSYTYDNANNRSTCTKGGVLTNYGYNTLNQLTSATTGSTVVNYGYDNNGNRTSQSGGGKAVTLAFDCENRLIDYQDSTSGLKIGYTYDYRTRRVDAYQYGGTVPAGNVANTKFVFSGGTSVAEYPVDGSTPLVSYIRGSDEGGGIGGILYSVRPTTGASFNHYNSRGDVITKTDGAGAITFQQQYLAFGNKAGSVGTNPDRQGANTKDLEITGLINDGMRMRDADTGTFITRDPAGFVDGPNLYTYVRQNPWTKFDPEGLSAFGIEGYEWSDYWHDVGQMWLGYGDAGVDTVTGVAHSIAHPIQTVEGIGNAVAHPIKTAQAIAKATGDAWESGSRGQGRVVGNALIAIGTAATPFTKADQVEKVAEILNIENKASAVEKPVQTALDTVKESKNAASELPQMKGMGASEREATLKDAGFVKTKTSNSAGKNETWNHEDGSEVRVHPYGNEKATPYKSANNAHMHKEDPAGNQLNDRGNVSTNPNDTHIGLPNPRDLPEVRDRPHGS